VVAANGYGRGGKVTHLKLAIHDEEEAALIRSQDRKQPVSFRARDHPTAQEALACSTSWPPAPAMTAACGWHKARERQTALQ
jgi:hypothetical protein